MKKSLMLLVLLVLVTSLMPLASAAEKEKLMVYTSMKETLIGDLRDAFMKQNPNIQFDYY